MRCFKILVHLVLLLTIPSFALYPIGNVPLIASQASPHDKDYLYSFDEITNLIDAIESGELEKRCSLADLERINHFLTNLAIKGVLPDAAQCLALQQDIQELNSCEYLFSFAGEDGGYDIVLSGEQGEIILCKSWFKEKWDQTRKFVKRNKKAILIGAAVIVGTAAVICAIAAASTAAAAAAGVAASGPEKEDKTQPVKKEEPQAPILQAILDEHVSSFKEQILEEELYSITPDASLGETIKTLGANFAHEALEGIADLVSVIPRLNEEIKEVGSQLFPSITNPPSDLFSPKENCEKLIEAGHQTIDRLLSTNPYVPKKERLINDFASGLLPLPFGLNASKFKGAVRESSQSTALVEEAGLASREVALIDKTGNLEKVANIGEGLIYKRAMRESAEKYKSAEASLDIHKGKYFEENQLRELIQEAGIKTFPRPQGIPENYRIKLTDKSGGMKYVHPTDVGTYVRVMPGKPHSPHPHQRKPYVNQRIKGKSIDKYGNIVSNKSPKAHIPLEEYIYRSN